MLTLDYNRAARKELFDSSLHYAKQVQGLGERFLTEVEDSLRAIAHSPDRFPKYFNDIRRCVMPQFPYGI
jgi:toxin ParE1/3/4